MLIWYRWFNLVVSYTEIASKSLPMPSKSLEMSSPTRSKSIIQPEKSYMPSIRTTMTPEKSIQPTKSHISTKSSAIIPGFMNYFFVTLLSEIISANSMFGKLRENETKNVYILYGFTFFLQNCWLNKSHILLHGKVQIDFEITKSKLLKIKVPYLEAQLPRNNHENGS